MQSVTSATSVATTARANDITLFASLELSKSNWVVTISGPGSEKFSKHVVEVETAPACSTFFCGQGRRPSSATACRLTTLFGRFPFLEKPFADSAYQGPIFADALAKILSRVKIEIVKRSDQAKGFVTLPKRWIVERTIAWLNRCRRLAKDWENLNFTALIFLRFASIRLMLRRLCNPS